MTNENLIVSLFWVAIALAQAVFVVGMLRTNGGKQPESRSPYLFASIALLSGAFVPTSIQYAASGGEQYWAGIPMLIAALYLLARGLGARPRPERPAVMTFREKSALVSLVATIGIYGWASYKIMTTTQTLAAAFGWLIGSTVLMIIVMAAAHAILALMRPAEKADERDTIIGWRSSRNAYYVLACSIWGVVALLFTGITPAVIVYAVIGVFVMAEICRLASELVYYRLPL